MRGLRAQGPGLTAGSSALSVQRSALPVRPLQKWAGGKRQLLPYLRRFYPPAFNRYIEPFFGSGAVFFDLHGAGRLRDCDVVLIDSNADLIGCYDTVRTQPDAVADELDALAVAHASGGQAHYYAVRDEQFNPIRDRLRGVAYVFGSPLARGAVNLAWTLSRTRLVFSAHASFAPALAWAHARIAEVSPRS